MTVIRWISPSLALLALSCCSLGQDPMANGPNGTSMGTETEEPSIRSWEIGLISANGIVLFLILLIISIVSLALVTRRKRTHHRFFSGDDENRLENSGNRTGEDQILYKNVVIEDMIAKGTFTLVHCAHEGYRSFAIKTLKDANSELGRAEITTEIERYKLIQKLDPTGHPNIIRYYGGSSDISPLFMCIDLMECGTLQSLLAGLKLGPIPEWYIEFVSQTIEEPYVDYVAGSLMYITLQVCRGMSFLGHYGITHRNLSVRNIFLTADLQAKIGNFGVPLEGNYYMVTERGKYLEDIAPENMQGMIHFSLKSDVWSFGILVYKVCTLGSDPFPGIHPRDIYHEIGAGRRPNVLKCCDNTLYFLLQRCWQHSPSDRPFFPTLQAEFEQMIEEPSNHIILELNESEEESGYLDESGVAHLFRPPVHLLDGTGMRDAKRPPLLQEWKKISSQSESVDGPALDKRPTPLGKDKEKTRRGRAVVRQLPTLETAKASITGKHNYLPAVEEAHLLEEEFEDLEELDISHIARGDPMPLTHAGSNLSVYSEESIHDEQ